ncbi:MAG TPA: KpsF/GutQ family sugar-phosphate isomerase [candidate division Zixibacteria bacterium]|nr:KpsF/GutQ family sugar-phosphate isomerase [candidate division Zixibacteria bacterium]
MILDKGRDVIKKEAAAIAELAERLDENFTKAVELILECRGRVIVTGMGKSGLIGKKVAATFASIGIPAFFLHPAEAVHGDLGLVRSEDILIAISKSGATEELNTILPTIKRLDVKIILLTGQMASPLASKCNIALDCSVRAEACPNNLVPTSSTTAALVMGDALAIALLEKRNFTAEDFAHLHPGGSLGRRLLMRVEELMHTNSEIPLVKPGASVPEAILEITGKRLGTVLVANDDDTLAGIFTDGDLRRLVQSDKDFHKRSVGDVMVKNPKTIKRGALLDEALAVMEKHSITVLAVVNRENQPIGIIHLHDILKSKLV